MPARLRLKRRQKKQTDFDELTDDLEWELVHGEPFLSVFCDLLSDLNDFKAAWEIHRETLLANCVGHRPFAWWLLDHCRERPVVFHKYLTDPDKTRSETRYGFLHCMGLEPEPTYLRRLGLMSDEEIKAFDANQAEQREKHSYITDKYPELI